VDGVAFDGGRCRDRFRDNFGIHQKTLRARLDQAGAELREIENARDQRDEAGEMSETMRRVRLENESAKKNWPARRIQPSGPLPGFFGRPLVGNAVKDERRRGGLVVHAGVRLRSVEQCQDCCC